MPTSPGPIARVAGCAATPPRLDELLVKHGFRVSGDCPLFRLAHTPDAARWFEALGAQGVLVRPFDHTPDALRFGLPAAGDWARLEAALDAARV